MGPLVGERARVPWMEQLTKAVQQLKQQLIQAKDPALGPTVVCNDPQVPPGNRYDQGPNRQVGPTKPRQSRAVDVLTVAKRATSPEIVIRSVSRSLQTHVPLSSNANSVRANGNNSRKVYLEVLVDGEPVNCLLDTGSEVTLIPGSLV